MGFSLLLPAVLAVTVGLAAGRLQRQLRPALATAGYTLLAAVAAVAVVSAVAVLASLVVARLPFLAGRLSWCRVLAADHQLPVWIATSATAAAVAMVVSAGLTARRLRHRFRGTTQVGGHLVVLPVDQPTAFAVPGHPGHVVVSAGMLRRLDAGERRVLLAHERAHLDLGHHRYLLIVDVAAAAVPVLRPLRDRVRFATERWADEHAALEVGDRALVARAICRAALAQHGNAPAMAMAGTRVPDRVTALLAENRPTRAHLGRVAVAVVVTASVIAVASTTLQLHHVAALAEHVCQFS